MGKDICNVVETMFKKVKKIAPYMAFKKVAELEKNDQIIKEIWGWILIFYIEQYLLWFNVKNDGSLLFKTN